MAGLIFIRIFILILFINFIVFTVGFPASRLDGPNHQKAYITTSYPKELTDKLVQLWKTFAEYVRLDIHYKLYVRVAGGCIALLTAAVFALCIRYCNKHVKALIEDKKELQSIQVVVQGVKTQDTKETDSKKMDDTPNEKKKNERKDTPESIINTNPTQENGAKTDTVIQESVNKLPEPEMVEKLDEHERKFNENEEVSKNKADQKSNEEKQKQGKKKKKRGNRKRKK